MWWVVDIFSPRYVHCDISAITPDGEHLIIADGLDKGVVIETAYRPDLRMPSVSFKLPVSDVVFWRVARPYLGEKYSWSAAEKAGIKFLGDDENKPGTICSENVAEIIIDLGKLHSELQELSDDLVYIKPWGKTPREIYDVLAQHLESVASR